VMRWFRRLSTGSGKKYGPMAPPLSSGWLKSRVRAVQPRLRS